MMNTFPARFGIGSKVELDFKEAGKLTSCEVVGVAFTHSKVYYDIKVLLDSGKEHMYLASIDSVFVHSVNHQVSDKL